MKRLVLTLLCPVVMFSCKQDEMDKKLPAPAAFTARYACAGKDDNYSLKPSKTWQNWEQAMFPVALAKDSVLLNGGAYDCTYTATGNFGNFDIVFNDTTLLHYYAVVVNQQGQIMDRQDTLSRGVVFNFSSGVGQRMAPDSCYRIYVLAQDSAGTFNSFKGIAPYRQGF